MRATLCTVCIVLVLAGCADVGRFYSFREHEFVRLGSARAKLVGEWRSFDGRVLMLTADGRHSYDGLAGCWDLDGGAIVLRSGCINFGSVAGGIVLPIAEADRRCVFARQEEELRLSACAEAGTYRAHASRSE